MLQLYCWLSAVKWFYLCVFYWCAGISNRNKSKTIIIRKIQHRRTNGCNLDMSMLHNKLFTAITVVQWWNMLCSSWFPHRFFIKLIKGNFYWELKRNFFRSIRAFALWCSMDMSTLHAPWPVSLHCITNKHYALHFLWYFGNVLTTLHYISVMNQLLHG